MATPTNPALGTAQETFWNSDQTVQVSAITGGTAATSLGKAEDAAHASGDTGVAVLAVRRDTAAVGSGTDGDYSTVNVDASGRVWTNTELPDAAALVDGAANATTPTVGAAGLDFNGSTWDRRRGNTTVTLLASAARTTTQTGADTTNYNARGIRVTLDMTTVGTGSVTLSIEAKDETSGKYVALLTGAAVTTNSTNVYKVYPGLTAAANSVANDVLSRVFRIVVTANNANSATYSVGYDLIV